MRRTIETKHSLPIRPRVAQIHTHSHHIRTFAFQCKSIFAEIRGDSHHIRKFTPHSHDGHTTFAWVHTGSHEFTYVNIREVLISIVMQSCCRIAACTALRREEEIFGPRPFGTGIRPGIRVDHYWRKSRCHSTVSSPARGRWHGCRAEGKIW